MVPEDEVSARNLRADNILCAVVLENPVGVSIEGAEKASSKRNRVDNPKYKDCFPAWPCVLGFKRPRDTYIPAFKDLNRFFIFVNKSVDFNRYTNISLSELHLMCLYVISLSVVLPIFVTDTSENEMVKKKKRY